MAKRVFQAVNFTPTATADASTLSNLTYMALKGGSTTQQIDILEVLISGLANATGPAIMQLSRCGALETTATALAAPNGDGPMNPATAALAAPPVSFVAANTGPQRSNATNDGRLQMALNTFGGIIRWNAAPNQQWTQLGNATTVGETILSAFTGTTPGAVSAHIMYEPY